jgi:hypothetical protein
MIAATKRPMIALTLTLAVSATEVILTVTSVQMLILISTAIVK